MKTQMEMEVYFLVAFLSFLPCVQGSTGSVILFSMILIPATFLILICCCALFPSIKSRCKKCHKEGELILYSRQSPSPEAARIAYRHPYHLQMLSLVHETTGKRITRLVPKSTRSLPGITVHEHVPRHIAVSTRGAISTRRPALSSTSTPPGQAIPRYQSATVTTRSERQACDSSNSRSPVISTISSPQRHGLINTQYQDRSTIAAPPTYDSISSRDPVIHAISAPPPFANSNSRDPDTSTRSAPPPYNNTSSRDPAISTITAPPPYAHISPRDPATSTISEPQTCVNTSSRHPAISTTSAPPPYNNTTISTISSLPAYEDINRLAPGISTRSAPPAYENVNTQNPITSTISDPPPYENTNIRRLP